MNGLKTFSREDTWWAVVAQTLDNVQLLKAFHDCFRGAPEEVHFVDFEVEHQGPETLRRTRIRRGGQVVRESELTPIQRT